MPIRRPIAASLAFSLMALGLAHCVADAPVDATQADAGGMDGSMSEAGGCGADTVACGGKCVAPNDPTACGSACVACTAPANGTATCNAGVCGVTCGAMTTMCGAACAATQTDATNCGRCGRSCGTSTCSLGACVPQVINASANAITGLALAGTDVIFSRVATPLLAAIQRCPKTGCAGAPSLLFTDTSYFATEHTLTADANYAYFLGADSINSRAFRFGLGAQPTAVPEILVTVGALMKSLAVDGKVDPVVALYANPQDSFSCTGPFECVTPANAITALGGIINVAMTDTHFVASNFVGSQTPSTGIFTCPRPACTSKTELVSGPKTDTPAIVTAFADVAYWIDSPEDPIDAATAGRSRILSCAVTGCGGTPTVVVSGEDLINNLTVDASGVYFTVSGKDALPTGSVKACRTLTGCGTSSETLAKAQAVPNDIVTDATSVFWINTGNAGASVAVMSVAK